MKGILEITVTYRLGENSNVAVTSQLIEFDNNSQYHTFKNNLIKSEDFGKYRSVYRNFYLI